jgi:adenylate cyclase
MGDEDAADLAGEFCATVRDLAPDHDAEGIKAIGDALMGDDAGGAIRFGLRVANDVGGRHVFPTVRVGMHTGPVVERDGDWVGASVNIAARVSGAAAGGEVPLTEATRTAAGEVDGIEFEARGSRGLKNVAEPILLRAALPESSRSGEELPIDPACRMALKPARAAGMLVHDGIQYHSCSLECVGRFAADPDRYATAAPAA